MTVFRFRCAGIACLFLSRGSIPEIRQISLRLMPPFSVQRPLLDQFQQRVLALLHESSATEHPLSRAQAELAIWQQLEAEIIASMFVLEPMGRNTKEGSLDEQR
jgi:hypothetical protein